MRRTREEHAARFNYDLRAIYEDFKRIEKELGLKVVSLPPKRIPKPAEPMARWPSRMPNDTPDRATKPRTRSSLSKLLKHVENDSQSLAIERRDIQRAVLLTVRDAVPEPEVLRILGEDSRPNGTDTLTSRQIDSLIRKTRAARKSKRKKYPGLLPVCNCPTSHSPA